MVGLSIVHIMSLAHHQKADYLLNVKDNQPTLKKDTEEYVGGRRPEKRHGRVPGVREKRRQA